MRLNNIMIFISGRGSNLHAILKKEKIKKLKAQIKVVYSNKKDAPGLQIAKKYGKKTYTFPYKNNDNKLIEIVEKYKIDLIVLAGFMKILTPYFIEKFNNPIINIHPSLLPSFKGLHAQKQAFEAGVKYSGITIHFVDPFLDNGPIIFQKPVYIGDLSSIKDVEKRILLYEHRYYYQVINTVVSGKWYIKEKKVIIHE